MGSRVVPPVRTLGLIAAWSCIVFSCHVNSLSPPTPATSEKLVLPHQHPNPEAVARELNGRVNQSMTRRRQLLSFQEKDAQCLTGNPIDDCWRCDPNWNMDRQRLADCAIGFGHDAVGGKGGSFYVVTNPSDNFDPANPVPGTLRFGVIQAEPLWIIFSGDMLINLKNELMISSFKTIDGRGANVEITGRGCLILDTVTNIIIHNVQVHHCKPSGNAKIRTSPTQVVARGSSDGDGISVYTSAKVWIDHCSLSYCTDGLIDVTKGSTAVTISNNFFSHHDKVMLLGHSDDFVADSGMQVTVAFNHFGEALMERMPRCRFGYFHVVNNDYTQWGMYAVGGSANPTINSQGNRYIAPGDDNNKEVTKRMDTDESVWRRWNWRTEGDFMVNGAFFVASGADYSPQYAEATSVQPLSASLIQQLTGSAGVLIGQRSAAGIVTNPGSSGGGSIFSPVSPGTGTGTGTGTETGTGTGTGMGTTWFPYSGIGDYNGVAYGSNAPLAFASMTTSIIVSIITISAILQWSI